MQHCDCNLEYTPSSSCEALYKLAGYLTFCQLNWMFLNNKSYLKEADIKSEKAVLSIVL